MDIRRTMRMQLSQPAAHPVGHPPAEVLPRQRRLGWPLLAVCATVCTALTLYLATAAPTITTRFGGTDGAELAAAALSGGVAHPSGYPTYMILARAALLLPYGEPAGRLALLSSLCAALAAGCAVALVVILAARHSGERSTALSSAAGLYAGLTLALCARVWTQAIIVEVYALHLLWLTLCTLAAARWFDPRPGGGQARWLVLTSWLCGLGLGTHVTLTALLPALAAAWLTTAPRPQLRWRQVGACLVAFSLGSAVYAALPVWGARGVVPSWGAPQTLAGFWAHVSGAEYRYLLGGVPWTQQMQRLAFASRDLVRQPGPVGLALAVWWGLPWLWRAERALLVLSAAVALSCLAFALSYGGADSSVYLLPWTWAWCIWAGCGAWALLTSVRADRRGRLARGGIGLLLAGALLWQCASQYAQFDLHADTSERDRVLRLMRALPPDAIVFTSNDADTFGLWYVQGALRTRPDVLVIDLRLLARPWYQAQLRRHLQVAAGTPLCRALATPRPQIRQLPQGSQIPMPSARELDGSCR